MIRRLLVSAAMAGVVFGTTGCKHRCCSSDSFAPRPYLPAGPTTIPPAGVPVTPGPAVLPPSGSGSLPPPDLTPASPSPAPAATPPPGRELMLPDPAPGGPSSRSRYPGPQSPGVLGGPVRGPVVTQSPEPPVAKPVPAAASTAEVAGLPGYTRIKDGVATGRKPALDGFDALKRTGYRSVVYLHPAGADTSAAREVAEKRGLQFTAIETTPASLPAAFDAVVAAIGENKTRPVYVFDDDGLRTGAVWYLYFRTVELESADVAKIRARSVGLADEGDGPRAFWAAIHQFLASR